VASAPPHPNNKTSNNMADKLHTSDKLLNRACSKRFLLECSARFKRGKFTRVSESFLDEIEGEVRTLMLKKVMSHPSIGVTLKGD